VCAAPPAERAVAPDAALRDHYAAPLARWRTLYERLRPSFAEALQGGPG
jgi:hypothetical protein